MHRTLPVVSQMFECVFMCMYMSVCVCVFASSRNWNLPQVR